VAMDARGFDSAVPRTYARKQVFSKSDWLLIVGAVALTATVLATTVLTGQFRAITA